MISYPRGRSIRLVVGLATFLNQRIQMYRYVVADPWFACSRWAWVPTAAQVLVADRV
jgi:hypothetical protein